MSSPTIFHGNFTRLLTQGGIIRRDGGLLAYSGDADFINNGHFELNTIGYAQYADAAGASPVDGTGGVGSITIARQEAASLSGFSFGQISKDAVNRQGHGISYDFSISPPYKSKTLRLSFEYSTSVDYVSNDFGVYLYDVTNNALVPLSTNNIAANTSVGVFVATFTAPANSTSLRLIFHCASVSALAYTISLDSIAVQAAKYVMGASSGSTDNAVARWDGTTGTLLQNSPVTITDGGLVGISDAAFTATEFLHIQKSTNGSIAALIENVNVGASAQAHVRAKADTGSFYFGKASAAHTSFAGAGYAYTDGNFPFQVWTNNVKRLEVAGNGKVTISNASGTDDALVITQNSTINKYALNLTSANNNSQEVCKLTISNTNAVAGFVLEDAAARLAGFGLVGTGLGAPYGGNFVFYTSPSVATMDLVMLARNGSTKFRVFAGGTAAGNEQLAVASTGAVIGAGSSEIAATYPLTVYKNSTTDGNIKVRNAHASGYAFIDMFDNTNTKQGGFGYYNGGGYFYFYSNTKKLYFSTDLGVTEHLSIATTGRSTFTNTVVAGTNGVSMQITSSGSGAGVASALKASLLAGYTGSSGSFGVYAQNQAAGTASNEFTNVQAANYGEYIATTTGTIVGQAGYAEGGNKSYGGFFRAIVTKAGSVNIGCGGFASNGANTEVGGFFGLMNAAPTYVSAALIADNGSTTNPIFLGRDNGTTVLTVANGGLTTLAPVASSSGSSPTLLTITGPAHTGLTAGEVTDININLARTVTQVGTTGSYSNQRVIRIQAPTYAFSTTTHTIQSAVTVNIEGAPVSGTNGTIQFSGALNISGTSHNATQSAYGIKIEPSGKTGSANLSNLIDFNISDGFAAVTLGSGGTITSLYRQFIGQSTYDATSAVTVSNAPASLYIAGPPIASTNVTFSNAACALIVASGVSRFAGEVNITAGGINHDAGNIGFFGATPAVQQTSGANLTNNVTSGGTDNQVDNWTDLTTYATDAAAIRNAVYQLARKVKQVNDSLRTYGLLT